MKNAFFIDYPIDKMIEWYFDFVYSTLLLSLQKINNKKLVKDNTKKLYKNLINKKRINQSTLFLH